MSKMTPMMRQYLEIKSAYPDAILFFRLGDFYEMFLDDAVVASRVLDITLTSRNKGANDEVPLCGIPYHSCQPYVAKLVENGHKVAICEQVEDPKQAKGIVRREVVRVVTPGLVVDSDSLRPKENNFLMTIVPGADERIGVAVVDITTGEFKVTEVRNLAGARSEITAYQPSEVVFPEGEGADALLLPLQDLLDGRLISRLPEWVCENDRCLELLKALYQTSSLASFGCADQPGAIAAAGTLLHYLDETQKGKLEHLQRLSTYHSSEFMVLDDATRRNLELVSSLHDGGRKGSLLGVLDRTMTAMGGRKLRNWINQPLVAVDQIRLRQQGVAELVGQELMRNRLREALDGIYDLERLNAKLAMANANAKDLVALKSSLRRLPELRDDLAGLSAEQLIQLERAIDPLDDLTALVEAAIHDEPPFVLREGGLIKDGYHAELDELRTVTREGKGWIANLEQREKERTGIPNLKIRYNRVFGYYLEVTKSHIDKVPEAYQRRQTLANAERYITPELQDYEAKVLGAEEKIVELEYRLFQQVRLQVVEQGGRIQQTAAALATLDVLAALAELAHDRQYVIPEIDDSRVLTITDGRHPVVESMSLDERFVPNDVELDTEQNQLLIITGPNMAGKSTYMRQVALITLMAQMGSLVPAKAARIGVVDRIFTRVGASDNLARGQSTFMVEMTETANILNHATPRSLIILDEIGRGTSTFDGVSIAWSVAEYLHDHAPVAAKTLFATHYHELTDLALTRDRIKNYNIAVKEWNDQIVFLRRIVKGGTSHSYGIQVARLAGLPQAVIDRAKEVLRNLESGEFVGDGEPRLAKGKGAAPASPQLSLFAAASDDSPIRKKLEETDVTVMTPIEALNFVDQLKKLL